MAKRVMLNASLTLSVSLSRPLERARPATQIGDRNRPHKHVQRARIILHSADRLPVLEVAAGSGVSTGLPDLPPSRWMQGNRRCKLPRQRMHPLTHSLSREGLPVHGSKSISPRCWALPGIAKEVSMTKAQVL